MNVEHLGEAVGSPRLFDLSGAMRGDRPVTKDQPVFVASNQGGLMNRFVGLLSTIYVSERSGHRALAWWARNTHSMGMLDELLDLERSGITEIDPESMDQPEIWWAYDQPEPLRLERGSAILHTCNPIVTDPPLVHSYAELGKVFQRLTLSSTISQRIAAFDTLDFARTLGFHIRKPYVSGAFSEIENAKFKLSDSLFLKIIDDVLSGGVADQILLCTNNPLTEDAIKTAFGEAIIIHPKASTDNTSDPAAVQDALVDLMLLSKCRRMISQHGTGFGVLASVIGENTLLRLSQDSTVDHYPMSWFDRGVERHVEGLSFFETHLD